MLISIKNDYMTSMCLHFNWCFVSLWYKMNQVFIGCPWRIGQHFCIVSLNRKHRPWSWVERSYDSTEHVWTCNHRSSYITQQSYETSTGSYGIAGPAVYHYYWGGQTGALDTGVLCVPGSYSNRKLEPDKLCVNMCTYVGGWYILMNTWARTKCVWR